MAGLQLSAICQQQRDELLSLADELTRRIATVEQWLQAQAKSDARVQRLQTHPGVGLLTSLCLVHTLGDLSRFPSTRKVAAYVGFDPMEDSSAERKAYGGISKAGSRLLRYLLVEAGQTVIGRSTSSHEECVYPMTRMGFPAIRTGLNSDCLAAFSDTLIRRALPPHMF